MEYLGVRITLPEDKAAAAIEKLWPAAERPDVFWCVHSPHAGDHDGCAHTHVHVVVPYAFEPPSEKMVLGAKEKLALQKRVNRLDGYTLKGNSRYAISIYTNGYEAAMTYMKHQVDAVFHGSEEMYAKFVAAPAWVERREHMQPEAGDCNDIHKVAKSHLFKQLNEANIVAVMRKHVRLRKLTRLTFPDVLEDLLKHSQWRIGPSLRRDRIPMSVVDEFENGVQSCAKMWVDRYMPFEYKSRRVVRE